MKSCTICKIEKPAIMYRKNHNRCRECENIRNREWHRNNKEKSSAYSKQYYSKPTNKNRKNAKAKARYHDDSDVFKRRNRNSALKKTFGIDIIEYDRMREEQGFCCALCKKPESNFKRRLAVDHNHSTGRIRGLLCFPCNKFKVAKHSIDTARAVMEYLIKYDFEEIK